MADSKWSEQNMEDKEIQCLTAPILQHRIWPKRNRDMDKRLHLAFSIQMWPQNHQELPRHNPYFYRSKIYNALLFFQIKPEIEKILKKTNWFSENLIHNITDSDSPFSYRRSFCLKSLEVTIMFVDFSKTFDSIHRGKSELILLVYGLPKETVTAIMML